MTTTTATVIRKTPNVMGGEACIRQTRIAVWGLVNFRQLGFDDVRIIENFPEQLSQDDLDAAWAYYHQHPHEIEEAIRRIEEA